MDNFCYVAANFIMNDSQDNVTEHSKTEEENHGMSYYISIKYALGIIVLCFHFVLYHHMITVSKIRKNIYRARRTSYIWALGSFQMFTSPLCQIKLHLLSAVSLSGFQSSLGALKSTEHAE